MGHSGSWQSRWAAGWLAGSHAAVGAPPWHCTVRRWTPRPQDTEHCGKGQRWVSGTGCCGGLCFAVPPARLNSGSAEGRRSSRCWFQQRQVFSNLSPSRGKCSELECAVQWDGFPELRGSVRYFSCREWLGWEGTLSIM